MRVALVTPYYPPHLGGVETHTSQLARHLSGMGIGVVVLTQAPRSEQVDVNGISVRKFKSMTGSDTYPVAPGITAWLGRNRQSFDLVHAHSHHGSAAFLAVLSWRGPVVFTPHHLGGGHTRVARALHRVYRPATRLVFHRASAVICVSSAEADHVGAEHPDVAGRIRVIPNGLDTALLAAADPLPVSAPLILCANRLAAYKNTAAAIDAMGLIHGAARLVVLGDGPDRGELERRARRIGPTVELRGTVGPTEMARWLRTASVVVSLSERESFGISALEGLAAGARAVLSDIPAHREIVDRCGASDRARFVSIPPRPSEVAAAVDDSLALPRPDDTVTVLTWRQVAERTASVYAEVLGGRSSA